MSHRISAALSNPRRPAHEQAALMVSVYVLGPMFVLLGVLALAKP